MALLRSTIAILAGFWFMLAASWAGSVVAARVLLPDGAHDGGLPAALPVSYLVARILASASAAVMGGWLAARLAPSAPFGHACVLAAILAVMSLSLFTAAPAALWWHSVANAVLGPLAVLLGGKLRAAAAVA